MKYFNLKKHKKGFTLLFAALIVSLILSISIAIVNITLAQLLISTSGRQSQISFYNADMAVECALYYDRKIDGKGGVGSSFFPTTIAEQSGAFPMVCNGYTSTVTAVPTSSPAVTTRYTLNIASPCVSTAPSFLVDVTKYAGRSGGQFGTLIEARGYDTCDTTNLRRAERGLQVYY